MSQSQGNEGYKSRVYAGYAEAKRKAKAAYAHSVTSSLDTCTHEDNLMLVLFLREASDAMAKEGSDNIAQAYARCAKELRRHPLRVHNKDTLLAIHGFGQATVSCVQKHFWSDPECAPPEPSSHEMEAAKKYYEGVQAKELNKKAAEKQRKAEERQAKKNKERADEQLALSPAKEPWERGRGGGSRGGGRRGRGGRGRGGWQRDNLYAGFDPDEIDPFIIEMMESIRPPEQAPGDTQAPPAKRQRQASKKEYIPGVGTANYAFLIALFQSQQKGELYVTKHDLVNRAEALHITNKPISANANAPIAPGQFVYNGWNCFTQLCNREPPLAQVYSNPKKCRLTPEGEAMARRLYLDAVERQSIPADPSIMSYIRRIEGNKAEQSCAADSQPMSQPASQAPAGSQAAARKPPKPKPTLKPKANSACPLQDYHKNSQSGVPDVGFEPWQPHSFDFGGVSSQNVDFGQRSAQPAQQTGANGRSNFAGDDEVIDLDSDSEGEGCAPGGLQPSQHLNPGAKREFQQNTKPPPAKCAPAARSASQPKEAFAPVGARRESASGPCAAPRQPPSGPAPSFPGRAPSGASSMPYVSSQSGTLDDLSGAQRAHHTQNRLQAQWRLPPVVENGSAEETNIRLPPLQPGECFEDRYEVVMVLDHRERFGNHIHSSLQGNGLSDKHSQAVKQLTDLGVKVLSRSMEIGDAFWIAQPKRGGSAYSLDTIIERKRVDDLVASIKDQRYERQKYYLARCGIRRTMYVLEGNIDLTVQGPMAKACKTAMHRVEVEDGFRVIRTTDSSQTFKLYQRLTVALQKKYARLNIDSPNVARAGEQLPTLESLEAKLRLAKKVTLRDVWGLMLCAVPRISSESCEAILQKYPTPISLWKAYEETMKTALGESKHPVAAANTLLAKLPKIGQEASRSVYQTLFANGWDVTKT